MRNFTKDELEILSLSDYRFADRVEKLMKKGLPREDAQDIVAEVILTKEYPYDCGENVS